jgi:CheY-like chemotaxis protein
MLKQLADAATRPPAVSAVGGESLQGCRVLVVEDEVMLAYDLHRALEDAGACVLGPVQSVDGALALLRQEQDVHGAVLDINLNGQMVFPVADALSLRGIPFVFATGYQKEILPSHYRFVTRCEKPVSMSAVADAIGAAMFAFLDPGTRRRRLTMGRE